MPSNENAIKTIVEQRRQDMEDIGLIPSATSQFLTVLSAQLEIDLAQRVQSTPAAQEFVYSIEADHSEALQAVRGDDLLAAIYEDLQASKMAFIDVYKSELPYVEAGEFDEEDMAMHETLKRRINGIETAIINVADLRGQPDKAFETLKSVNDASRKLTIEKSRSVNTDLPPH